MARKFCAYRGNPPRTHLPDTLPRIPGFKSPVFCIPLKNKTYLLGGLIAHSGVGSDYGITLEDSMLAIHVEDLGNLAVVECKGRVVRSESVFKLRDVVLAQAHARIVALDLSEVEAMGGGGLGMLVFLDRWARNCGIQFKLLSPSGSVVEGLVANRSVLDFEIMTFNEMMSVLDHSNSQYAFAA
jgi:anti-anti-sigma regulatory factor